MLAFRIKRWKFLSTGDEDPRELIMFIVDPTDRLPRTHTWIEGGRPAQHPAPAFPCFNPVDD